MSKIARIPPSKTPVDSVIDPQSEAIAEAVKKLIGALPKSEQQRILRELTATLEPITAPRAGEVLGAIVSLMPRKRNWSVTDLKAAVAATGVQAAPKEVYNALGYLVRKGRVQRIGYGRYLVEGALLVTSEDLGGEPGRYEDD